MTKYILNSGGLRNEPELKKKFHIEIVKGFNNKNPRFLLCNFAQQREYWEVKFSGYSNSIAEDMPQNIRPEFELAMPNTFVNQCKEADIIYFHGGDDHLLQFWMRRYDFRSVFNGKVVATNSASSDMLAAHFWTLDWRTTGDGFGILPIKFMPHYESVPGPEDPRGPINWQKAYEELESYGDPSLPIYALREGEFTVFEQ